jgi:short-subunit dehydrogenase
MIQLNILTLTALTRFLLPGMVARGKGRVMNVASTAAFMPGPLQAVYFATKAYVLSFTQAIAVELDGTGVTATALCPGYTETGFKDAADLGGTALVHSLSQTPEEVAATGYSAMLKGQTSVVSGAANKVLAHGLTRILPRGIAAKLAKKLQEKKG